MIKNKPDSEIDKNFITELKSELKKNFLEKNKKKVKLPAYLKFSWFTAGALICLLAILGVTKLPFYYQNLTDKGIKETLKTTFNPSINNFAFLILQLQQAF